MDIRVGPTILEHPVDFSIKYFCEIFTNSTINCKVDYSRIISTRTGNIPEMSSPVMPLARRVNYKEKRNLEHEEGLGQGHLNMGAGHCAPILCHTQRVSFECLHSPVRTSIYAQNPHLVDD